MLEYQKKFGYAETYKLRCTKRLSAIKVEIEVSGESFNSLKNYSDDELINGLLTDIVPHVSFAVPPIAGGAIMGENSLFTAWYSDRSRGCCNRIKCQYRFPAYRNEPNGPAAYNDWCL